MRDAAPRERRLGGPIVVPGHLEGVVALADRIDDLLAPTGDAVGLEEERAAAIAAAYAVLVAAFWYRNITMGNTYKAVLNSARSTASISS